MTEKTTRRTEDVKKTISTRLNRIDGQLHGIKKLVDEDKLCEYKDYQVHKVYRKCNY